jgi:hypothetical protein
MRKALSPLGLVLLFSLAGCADGGRFNLLRPSTGNTVVPTDLPPKENLVAYLNNNSARISGVQSDDVTLTCYTGGPVGIPVSGRLRAEGPRNFRMTADAFGNREVDLGSNDQEFWYWIRRGDKYQVFCSYQAIEEGRVKQQMPFPFQPDWVLEAMGLGKYGPPEKYELAKGPGQFKLIESTKSPQGMPVKKIIVFSSQKATKDAPQVTDYLLVDERSGKLICSAHIMRRQIINDAEFPREMELRWPEQNMKLGLTINGVKMNQHIDQRVFARTPLNGVQSFDLATGKIESGIQPAGGVSMPPGGPR